MRFNLYILYVMCDVDLVVYRNVGNIIVIFIVVVLFLNIVFLIVIDGVSIIMVVFFVGYVCFEMLRGFIEWVVMIGIWVMDKVWEFYVNFLCYMYVFLIIIFFFFEFFI